MLVVLEQTFGLGSVEFPCQILVLKLVRILSSLLIFLKKKVGKMKNILLHRSNLTLKFDLMFFFELHAYTPLLVVVTLICYLSSWKTIAHTLAHSIEND